MSPTVTAALAAAGLTLTWGVLSHNRFVRLGQHLRDSWAGIDVELKRRHDLIPNLVNVVQGYTAHERGVLERVVELRSRAAADHPSREQLARDETKLMRAMKELFAVVEGYPQLKADRHFLELQDELAITEDRIAAARRFYNGNVRDFTVLRDSFPSSLIARLFGFKDKDPGYFELTADAERVVPRL
ncbi:MAG: LemA family protein [Gemmatimonadota bacterium]|nr:LemA family protein [Gemmatimonadota bacterium]MDH4350509.1 LemA family protein [Gemmatimonadota bacterium]MDH5197345.1 LemA family protein [Gemmatimonadota bacterium]